MAERSGGFGLATLSLRTLSHNGTCSWDNFNNRLQEVDNICCVQPRVGAGTVVKITQVQEELESAFQVFSYDYVPGMELVIGTEQTVIAGAGDSIPGIGVLPYGSFGMNASRNDGQPVWIYPLEVIVERNGADYSFHSGGPICMGVPDSCSYDCGGVFDPFVRDCGDLMQRLVDQPISSQMVNFRDRCAQLDPVSIAVALDDAFCDICGDSVLSSGRHIWAASLHDTYCNTYDDDISFSELPAAQAACAADPACQFVYDGACDGQPYRVCRGPETVSSESGSCLISQMIDEECDDGAHYHACVHIGQCHQPHHQRAGAGELNSEEPDAHCRTDCRLARCGDGIVDSDEDCDDGTANSDAPDSPCRTDCTPRRCGDAVVDSDEMCDAGAPTKHTTSYFPFFSVRSVTTSNEDT
jgi:hypothetical protein